MRNPNNYGDLIKVSHAMSLYIVDRKLCKKLKFDDAPSKTSLEDSKISSKKFVPLHKLLDGDKTDADFIDNFN